MWVRRLCNDIGIRAKSPELMWTPTEASQLSVRLLQRLLQRYADKWRWSHLGARLVHNNRVTSQGLSMRFCIFRYELKSFINKKCQISLDVELITFHHYSMSKISTKKVRIADYFFAPHVTALLGGRSWIGHHPELKVSGWHPNIDFMEIIHHNMHQTSLYLDKLCKLMENFIQHLG